jgi:iron(II)-dependent oxidoreductase
MRDNLRTPDWEARAATAQDGVFASRFPNNSSLLWTMVNRNEYDVSGPELRIPFHAGICFHDLWHGSERKPSVPGNEAILSFEIEGRGFAAVLATEEDPAAGRLNDILALMAQRSRRLLSSFWREWKAVPQTVVESKATKPASAGPSGMLMISGGDYDFKVTALRLKA